MNRLVARLGVLALPALLAGQVLAQQVQQAQTQSAQTSRVEEAAHKEPVPASKPAAAPMPYPPSAAFCPETPAIHACQGLDRPVEGPRSEATICHDSARRQLPRP